MGHYITPEGYVTHRNVSRDYDDKQLRNVQIHDTKRFRNNKLQRKTIGCISQHVVITKLSTVNWISIRIYLGSNKYQ